MAKKTAAILSTLAMLALTALAVMPVGANVIAPDGPRFAAGNYSDGICSCPVNVGDCVCKYTPPADQGPQVPTQN